MDRQTVYAGQVVRAKDLLLAQQNIMVALAELSQTLFGASSGANAPPTLVDGFTLTPTTPQPILSVNLGAGTVYQLENLEATSWSSLAASTSAMILKQGIQLVTSGTPLGVGQPAVIGINAPATPGFSWNILVEVAYTDIDGGSLVLPYYNAANPTSPFSGPGNAGTAQNTVRYGGISWQLKYGTAAASGTQTTPVPDPGFTGLFIITVANGASGISQSNITTYSAPIQGLTPQLAGNATALAVNGKLQQIPLGVQAGSWNYAADTGAVNALVASISPAPPMLVSGLTIKIKIANTNTGASTLNLNGFGNIAIHRANGNNVAANDLLAGEVIELVYDGSFWQITNYQGYGGSNTTNNFSISVPYGTDTGTVNAVVATCSPNGPSSLAAGIMVEVKILNTNTGASTANINSLGAVAIVDRSGQPLVAGAMMAGEVALLIYDGTRWQLNADYSTTAIAHFKGLTGLHVNAAKTSTFSIEQIVATVGLGGAPFLGLNLSLTFNGGTTGINGMDTGTMPANKDISVYAIYNPTTNIWATLGTNAAQNSEASSVYLGSFMPSGYTASCLIFVGSTGAGGNWYARGDGFVQIDRNVYVNTGYTVVSNGHSTTATPILIPGFPFAIKSISGEAYITANNVQQAFIDGDNNFTGEQCLASTSSGIGNTAYGSFCNVPIFSNSATFYYYTTAASAYVTIWVTGYTF